MDNNKLGKSVDFNGIQIYFDDYGAGETIVLLHGFLEDRSIWNNLINEVQNSYRVITIDLPGHGESGCFSEVHSMEDMAKSVKAVLDFLAIEKLVIAGHSMGGYVALAFAELFPFYVKGICLINSTPLADGEDKRINRDRAVEAVRHNKMNFVGLTLPSLFSAENREKYVESLELLKAKASLFPVDGITAALLGMKERPDRSHILLSGQIPSLLIIGKNDTVVHPESLKQFYNKKLISIAELEGGHMSYIEAMEDLSYFLLLFIENL